MGITIVVLVKQHIKPLFHLITLIFLESQEYLGGVFRVHLYFRLSHIVPHLQLTTGDLVGEFNNVVGEDHVNVAGGELIEDLDLRTQRTGVQRPLNQLFDRWIQPDGADRHLGVPGARVIVALSQELVTMILAWM